MALFKKPSDNKEELTPEEYEKFFKTYFSAVRNFLYYKTADIEMAEDITQDAFFKLWENRLKVDKSSLKAYIYTIANNLTINQLKRNQLKFKFLNLQSNRQSNLTPEYLLEMQEFDQKLQNALSDLPEGAREVFLMNRIEGMKYHEIAERLELSVKAVEKRMSKALAILRDKIDYKL